LRPDDYEDEFPEADELGYEDEGPEPPPDDYEEDIPSSSPVDKCEEEPGVPQEARPQEPTKPAAEPAGKPRPTLAIRMADIQPEPVEWLWHP
jgi:hypothetical protein